MEFEFPNEVDNLDAVPEKFRPLYTQAEDGKPFTLDAKAAPLAADAVTASKNLSKARKDLTKANGESAVRRTALKEFDSLYEDLGIDQEDQRNPAGLKAQMDAIRAKAQKGENIQGDIDKIRTEMSKKVDEVSTAKDVEIAERDSVIEGLLVNDTATTALAKNKGATDLLLPHIKAQCRVARDSESKQYAVHVLDGQGETRYSTSGNPLTIDELVVEMKGSEMYARAFESDAGSGPGIKPAATKRPGQITPKGDNMNSTDKIAAGLNAL